MTNNVHKQLDWNLKIVTNFIGKRSKGCRFLTTNYKMRKNFIEKLAFDKCEQHKPLKKKLF